MRETIPGKQILFGVGMRHDITGERLNLKVWAEDVDEATHKVVAAIGGPYGEYTWTGTGPEYENNQVITRDKKG